MIEPRVPGIPRAGRRVLPVLGPLLGLLLLGACTGAVRDGSITTTAPGGAVEQIPTMLSRPEGPGPFPAVVILHDCSGLGPRSSGAPARWAKELVAHGYVAIIPDSFTTRGHAGGVCTNPSPSRLDVSPARRAHDAYAALAYARTVPHVDGRRVGVMGGSHGGSTTLATLTAPDSEAGELTRETRGGFAAAVALYPRCGARLGSWRPRSGAPYRPVAPLLILIGEKDDWTPAEDCRKLAEGVQAAGFPVTIKVYPGAHHSFDSRNPVRYVEARINPSSPTGRGATTGGHADAWADSIREVLAFFGQHLARAEK